MKEGIRNQTRSNSSVFVTDPFIDINAQVKYVVSDVIGSENGRDDELKPEDQWPCKRSPETRDIYQ